MRCRLLLLVAVLATAGGSSPSAPLITPPLTPTRWPLAGTVRSSLGVPIDSAVVAILDGPDAGRQTTTDAFGRFAIPGLSQASFTLRATANGYQPASKGITLTSDVVVDLQLAPLPAALVAERAIQYDRLPGGGFAMTAAGVNAGEAAPARLAA